jgi:hypothetical protein
LYGGKEERAGRVPAEILDERTCGQSSKFSVHSSKHFSRAGSNARHPRGHSRKIRRKEENSEMERLVIPRGGGDPTFFVARGNKGVTGEIVVSRGNTGVRSVLGLEKRRKDKERRKSGSAI